jgi:taurine dioxygenase
MQISPVTPDLAAEIRGVDLRTATAAEISEIQQAFAKHSVLFIRDQDLTLDDQLSVTRKFGSVLRVPYVLGVASHPDVIAVL